MGNRSFVYYVDPYFVSHAHQETINEYASWLTLRQFGYGIYEFKAKVSGCDHGFEAMALEYEHGRSNNGLVGFVLNDGNYEVWATWSGGQSTGTLAGQDWTSETTFKFDWNSSRVIYYINGTSLYTISTNVPQSSMCLVGEAACFTGATSDAKFYFRNKSFRKL